MKSLVIYHANCADGFGAAFAAWLKLSDEAEYVACQYGDDAPDGCTMSHSLEGRDIYILDFSFPRDQMDFFFKHAKRVVWLDHHKSAFEMWEVKEGQRVWAETEGRHVKLHMDKSGAMLAWEYFHPGTEVPMFIQHIDDYDRWQFKIEGTKAFNKALWSYTPWSFEQWKEMFWNEAHHEDFSIEATGLIEEGNAILRAHEQNVQSVVKGGARPCSIVPAIINSSDSYKAPWVWWHDEECGDTCGANGIAANCPPHLASDVGHELANQSGTFGLLWSIDKDNICKCSLRSNGDYDVSAIAKAFGGGGHRNAAGFSASMSQLLEWLK